MTHFSAGAFYIAVFDVIENQDMFLGGFFVVHFGFRNAVNLGLVPVICKGISKKVKEGQTLTVDLAAGEIRVKETGESYPCEQLGEQAMKILEAGGIKALMRSRFPKK